MTTLPKNHTGTIPQPLVDLGFQPTDRTGADSSGGRKISVFDPPVESALPFAQSFLEHGSCNNPLADMGGDVRA
jgi:hypothetical protein